MIIDLILDRKDGQEYNAHQFYKSVIQYEDSLGLGHDISTALDSGTNKDVQNALSNYITEHGYNHHLPYYVKSVNWLDE